MEQKVRNRLFIIASLGLLIAGGIFLGIGIFDGNETPTPFHISLGCILLSSLFNILRLMNPKQK